MEENIEQNQTPKSNPNMLPLAIVIAGVMIAGTVWFKDWSGGPAKRESSNSAQVTQAALADGGHILPIDVEKKMLAELTSNGSIDGSKLPQVTELNLLWAFGLANKNPVLENGPIADLRYGGPTNMASVGGWTVTAGSVMDHYDKHALVKLTAEQQQLVEKMSKGIYRPCCNNSTYFPDCNHGMAMLGLLEYMASNGATEEQMWSSALLANMAWFPDTYQTIGQYLREKGIDLKSVTAQELLGAEYSSGSGFAKIASQVKQPIQKQGSGGCGVGSAQQPADLPKQQSGCGV